MGAQGPPRAATADLGLADLVAPLVYVHLLQQGRDDLPADWAFLRRSTWNCSVKSWVILGKKGENLHGVSATTRNRALATPGQRRF